MRTAAVATAVMLAVFIAAIASAWARGLQIDCGCFGGGGEVAAGQTAYASEIARDTALLLLEVQRTVLATEPFQLAIPENDPRRGPVALTSCRDDGWIIGPPRRISGRRSGRCAAGQASSRPSSKR